MSSIGGDHIVGNSTKRFGGGRAPTGTPSLAWSCLVVVASLLAGASVVHNIYKPNLTLPSVDAVGPGRIKEEASTNHRM